MPVAEFLDHFRVASLFLRAGESADGVPTPGSSPTRPSTPRSG